MLFMSGCSHRKDQIALALSFLRTLRFLFRWEVWAAPVPTRCTSEHLSVSSAFKDSHRCPTPEMLKVRLNRALSSLICWGGATRPWQRVDLLGPFQPKSFCNSKSVQPTFWTRQALVTHQHIHLQYFPCQHWHTYLGSYTFCTEVYAEPSCAFLVAAQCTHLRVPE